MKGESKITGIEVKASVIAESADDFEISKANHGSAMKVIEPAMLAEKFATCERRKLRI
jgi:hypothetical protein